jgi:hypothetical protein
MKGDLGIVGQLFGLQLAAHFLLRLSLGILSLPDTEPTYQIYVPVPIYIYLEPAFPVLRAFRIHISFNLLYTVIFTIFRYVCQDLPQ